MTQPLNVVFCWHMHQPFYREAESGRYHLPWVYLHAMKDYTDMAMILEQVPSARAVVNFVPSLTAQIDDYALKIRSWLDEQGELPDRLLMALAHEEGEFDADTRDYLLETCFRLNHERNMQRYPQYQRLWEMAEHAKHHEGADYLGHDYFTDLVTWYHLGWIAETLRQSNFVARRLIEKGRNFSYQDRRDLITLIAGLMTEIPARYRKLHDEGKIELSTTPYAHPIIPLMLDFKTAQATVSDAEIPDESYPDGRARAMEHIELGKRMHYEAFGHEAGGCWPAEGAVSEETLGLLGTAGFRWAATGEAVLHHSLERNLREHHELPYELYHPWLIGHGQEQIACFFRDDRLSDLIGFEYSRWNTSDAVANFMHELATIRHRMHGKHAPVVAIIMDGENAWEHYHENAVPFLTDLYQAIAEHNDYQLTTFSDYLHQYPATQQLEKLVPGSWVYGNFATWIGDHAKTMGWKLLIEAKHAYDAAVARGELGEAQKQAATEQLRICEGSDWCWWFGDYNPGPAVRDFDALYRQQLKKIYTLIGHVPPASLDTPISRGGGHAEGGGTMRRGSSD